MCKIVQLCLRMIHAVVTFVAFRRYPVVATRPWRIVAVVLAATSCADPDLVPSEGTHVAVVVQALVDTDADGLDDDWELENFGNLAQTATGDFDADGMTNGEEYTHGFDPTTADAFDDADGDRYPNIFEIRNSSDPNAAGSVPTPALVVNGSGGGTHTTVSAAVSAAASQSGGYVIIGLAPGTYTGTGNVGVTASSTTKKLLLIGLEGAAKTVVEGGTGWYLYNTTIVTSLTFQGMTSTALYAEGSSNEFRFVDLLVRENSAASRAGGIHVATSTTTHIVGSTFLNNTGSVISAADQIYIGRGQATLLNTVVWGQSVGPMVVKASSGTLTTHHCLVKGQTLSGTGNLAGTTEPKLRNDGRLRWDSPLRSAGGSFASSQLDMDGELRPSSTPDIGVDQFVDMDSDDLADRWELDQAGDLTTLTSRSQDADGDGLTNEQEYESDTSPTVADTDGDGLSDSDEVLVHGTNPRKTDTDGDDMPDAWEVAHGLAPLTPDAFDDADGDRFPNVYEYAYGTSASDRESTPVPTLVVNGSGGGTHTTVSAAVSAAASQSGSYVIIGLAPGTYTGTGNVGVTASSTTKKLLLIGLEGAAKTVVDGAGAGIGWLLYSTTVVSSLTFQGMSSVALYAEGSSNEFRFVDLLVRENHGSAHAGGIHVATSSTTHIVGSTFLNNTGSVISAADQIYIGRGQATLLNTVVWGQSVGPMVMKASSGTLTTHHCLVKGQTLSGTGNLAGTTEPKLRNDGRLFLSSPLRGAGGSFAFSRLDMDGELRPSSAPDIGVDQFVDMDSDDLADRWELDQAGDLTTLTSRSQDADGDGLTNEQEYENETSPTVADTDGDGLSDSDEVLVHGTNPRKTDTDGDDMPDAWEVAHGLAPLTPDAFDDADGDRFPNVYEYAYGTSASDRESTPVPTLVVNGSGGGTHTTVSAAVSAAASQSGSYVIIGLAPGTYTGTGNVGVTVSSTTKKLLLIGLEGAAKTVVDGAGVGTGWSLHSTVIVSSLTFRGMTDYTLYASNSSSEFRFVDLLVRENHSNSYAGGIHVPISVKTYIVGSTFLNNKGYLRSYADQIYIGGGQATLLNTVVWGSGEGPMVVKSPSASLTTNHCLVKGQTLSGTGNLAGTIAPSLRQDGRLRSDSPLRAAGGPYPFSLFDMDMELRAVGAPDIGVDQWTDVDVDGLPDGWERLIYGSVEATSGLDDDDNDGLDNANEYAWDTDPLNPDTDGDGLKDGLEIGFGLDPGVRDSDDLGVDLNDDGVLESIGMQLGYSYEELDTDGDSVSNADERLVCIDPLRSDSDGDGVSDNMDAFPMDPRISALTWDPQDVTPPVITLITPWYAIEQ